MAECASDHCHPGADHHDHEDDGEPREGHHHQELRVAFAGVAINFTLAVPGPTWLGTALWPVLKAPLSLCKHSRSEVSCKWPAGQGPPRLGIGLERSVVRRV